MASNLPLPIPPRTPSPLSDDGMAHSSHANAGVSIDRDSLSPLKESFPKSAALEPVKSDRLSPTKASFSFGTSPPENGTLTQNGSGESPNAGPFNFNTTVMAKSPVIKSVKHWATSWPQIQAQQYLASDLPRAPPRAPLALPNSLPMPTMKECRSSMSKDQKTRFWWSVCHMFVAAYTLWTAHGSLAMTALSHLILFDSLGALLCVVVDVLGNFEVWKRSSIRHPFGLERAEVLAGFAMCVLLMFMGLDLISHNLQHFLEKSGHEPHHMHVHERVSLGSVDITAVLAISSTLVSAIGLKNHARIGKAMRFGYIDSLPSVLSNPSHFLTLSCSTLLLLLPLVSIRIYDWLDKLLSGTIAISMCFLGVRLVKTLGSMLLMSYSGQGVSDVIKDIEADPAVFGIDDARFWQVHYGLYMANVKLRVSGTEDSLGRLREKISSLIRNRLGGGYGTGGQKWEVSLQFTIEKT
ncbi:guanosine-diphosphatase [Penicillium atrosanguineum]|uniref:guanosine-diphosphatase n=1 Tax=Penicillium atrosanguineum TaxID=1132637 RepID=UPI002399B07E|nr:guanosine-diphosphatase [Penicillium atrosanguineum]KAJ5314212.1 guanosine-diphosphatase [Penicillium atrosanguineum]